MGLKNYVINGLLFGLAVFAFLSFIYQMSADNNSTVIINDPYLNSTFNSINRTLSGVQQDAEAQFNNTVTEPATIGFGSLILLSIRGAGTAFSGTVIAIIEPVRYLVIQVLGIPPIVLGVLSAIIIITLIFLAWKMYRLGI